MRRLNNMHHNSIFFALEWWWARVGAGGREGGCVGGVCVMGELYKVDGLMRCTILSINPNNISERPIGQWQHSVLREQLNFCLRALHACY